MRMALRMARTRRPPPLQLCGQHRRRHRELRVQRRAERPRTALEAVEAAEAVGDAGGDEGRRAGRYRGFLDKHCLSQRRALEGRDYGRPRMHTTRAALRPDAEMKSLMRLRQRF